MKKVIAILFIVLIIIFSATFIRSYNANIFTTQKWTNIKNRYERIKMIPDLEKKHRIIGKNSNEIRELLGEPDWIYDSKQTVYQDFKSKGVQEYWIYEVKDDILVGWRIYLLGMKDDVVVAKEITVEDW